MDKAIDFLREKGLAAAAKKPAVSLLKALLALSLALTARSVQS